MRIPSGVTDQYIYFVAVDATDFTSRETGFAAFTVYRSRNGGTPAAMTTPTINETDTTNMPGVYELLLDEDMTIGAGNDSEEMVFHITHAGMAPVTRTIELYRPKITAGNTLDVTATGAAGIDWGNVENQATAVDLSATDIQLCDTITTYTGNTVQTGDSYARLGAPAGASVSADIATVDGNVDAILVDTGTTLETHLTDIKGATFAGATDSLEAIRDRGDAAWTTGAGGSDRLLMVDTTIATLASQTSFTLTAGSADDDAYNNCTIVVEDVSTSTQKAVGMVKAYTGATKTVTLKEALAFTIATTDKVYILAENSLKSTVANRQLDVTANGNAGIDWANVENPSTAVDLSATDIQLCDTVTTNTDMRGTDSAATAAELAKVPKSDGTVSWNATALASINAECDTALSDYDPPTRAELTTDIGTVVTDLDDIKGTGFVKDTHSLVNIEGYVDLIDDGTSGLAKIATDVAATLVDTAEIGAAGAGLTEAGGTGDHLTAVPWNVAWDVEVQSECADALTAYDPPTKAEVDALLTTQLTESYNTDGTAPTLTQALMGIYQMLTEKSVAGTTVTIKKLDGSTTAMTLTLDDATSPTSITRAT